MKASLRHPFACVAACACLAAAGCGADEEPEGRPLPADAATELGRRLDEVERRYRVAVDEGLVGACEDIENDSFAGPGGIDEILAALPEDVDPELRTAVEDSFENLRALTAEDCAGVEPPPETDTEVVPEEPLPEPELPTDTEPEPELPEDTVPEPEGPEEPEIVPPGQGGTPPGQGGTPPGDDGGTEAPSEDDG